MARGDYCLGRPEARPTECGRRGRRLGEELRIVKELEKHMVVLRRAGPRIIQAHFVRLPGFVIQKTRLQVRIGSRQGVRKTFTKSCRYSGFLYMLAGISITTRSAWHTGGGHLASQACRPPGRVVSIR